MRAFTATFGKIKIRTRIQIFMLQGMSQPVSAGGYEETFPHGKSPFNCPSEFLPRDYNQGWRDPMSDRMRPLLSLCLPGTSIPLNGPQTPFSQLILCPLDSQGAAGHGGGGGAGHVPQPSPCPRHLAPSCSFPFSSSYHI